MARDDIDRMIAEAGLIPARYAIVGADADSPGALQVLLEYSGEIDAFLKKARYQTKLSGLPISRASWSSPDLDISYSYVQGEEHVAFEPHVTPGPAERYPVLQPPVDKPPKVPVASFDQNIPPETPCMLVLYQGTDPDTHAQTPSVAAFDMAALAPDTLVPIYTSGVAGSSFQQPVVVMQIKSGSFEIIQTDVDLSGQSLKKSIVCTPLVFDAVSLGQQYPPVINVTPDESPSVFACSGRYSYLEGTFILTNPRTSTDTPYAVDSSGTYYYGASFGDETDIVYMTMDKTTIDETVLDHALGEFAEPLYKYVAQYDANWVNYTIENGMILMKNIDQVIVYPLHRGSPDDGYTIGIHFTTVDDQTQDNTAQIIDVVSTVIPNYDADTPPQYQNLLQITEILGESYYGTATVTGTINVNNIAMAYGPTTYYSYWADTNFYEYRQGDGPINNTYGGIFPRPIYTEANGLTIQNDQVQATATNETDVQTLSTTTLPLWGGAFYSGASATTTSLDTGPGGAPTPPLTIKGYETTSQGIIAYSTVAPSIPVPQYNYNTMTGPSFEQIEQVVENMIEQMNMPSCSPNGGPGPSASYGGNSYSSTYAGGHSIFQYDPVSGYPGSIYIEDAPSSSSGGTPITEHAPGYKAQTGTWSLSYTLSWLGQTIQGKQSSDSNVSTSAAIIVEPFPPGTPSKAYATRQDVTDSTTTTTIITPYKTFPNQSEDATLTGWMHVSNTDHILQGFLIDKTPYIYLDGTDITTSLAQILECATTDIAAIYFDIELSTIRQLSRIA